MTNRGRRITELLGLEQPIVLGPFGGLSRAELTAAVSDLGGLGSYGLYGYDGARIRETAAAIRRLTTRPFALNLWLPTGDEVAPGDVDLAEAIAATEPIFEELGLTLPPLPDRFLPDFGEQWEAVLEVRPAVVSLVYGVPDRELLDRAHAAGIRVLGTATTVDEAVALAVGGVDAVVATGFEAAGHRVSFLEPPERSLVGTFALIPQVVDAVTVPVIAAGGIADRRGVAAAFALGADAVQVGTAFLRTEQSAATRSHRQAITTTPATGTVLTRAMSGRLSRGVRNRAVRTLEETGAIAPFPAQNWLTGRFRVEAGSRDIGELLSLWIGQAGPLARHPEVRDQFAELVAGVPGGQ